MLRVGDDAEILVVQTSVLDRHAQQPVLVILIVSSKRALMKDEFLNTGVASLDETGQARLHRLRQDGF